MSLIKCLIRGINRYIFGSPDAEVAELADALDSGSSGHCARAGSSPALGTKNGHCARASSSPLPAFSSQAGALGTHILFTALHGTAIILQENYHFVYILYSTKNRSLYIGFSHNPIQRYYQHQNGEVQSTRPHRPYLLIYWECFQNKETAIRNEKRFKKTNLRRILRQFAKYFVTP